MPRAKGIMVVVGLASSLGAATASMPIASAAAVQANPQPGTDTMPVPASLQVPLLLKILTYDRNFTARTGSSLRIAVVFNRANQVSLRARDEITAAFAAFGDKTVRNLPVRHTALEYVSDSQVDVAVRTGQINVFYVTPGVSEHLDGLLRIARMHQTMTTTGVPEYVEKGVPVGIGSKLNRAQILINLGASKAVGSEFDVSLLRIARVIR